MAALTWRDVAGPNFSGVSQTLNSANSTMDRALSGLSDGLRQFSADQQVGVDGQILGNALRINDADKYRDALNSGQLLQGADLSKVSPKVLEQLAARSGQLLQQDATRQGITNSKQAFGANEYKQNRLVQQDQLGDAARPELAAQLGLTGAQAGLDLADQQQIANTRSGLASAALNRQATGLANRQRDFDYTRGVRDDGANQQAISEVGELLSNNPTTDMLRESYEQTKFSSPQARENARKYLEQSTGQRIYQPIDTPVATPGSGGKAQAGGFAEAPNLSNKAQAALSEVNRRVAQNSSTGVVADIERTIGDTRSIPEIAKEIGETYPVTAEINNAKLTSLIGNAMDANPNLSAAEVGAALQRSVTGNYLGSTRFGNGTGVDDSKFNANLEALTTGKADYMSQDNQRVRSIGSAITKADSALSKAKSDLAALAKRAESSYGVDTSAAEERVDRMQSKLDSAIQKQQDDALYRPVYEKPKSVREAGRPERNRAFKRNNR